MKAKTVNEVKNFERNLDPKNAMGIGKSKEINMQEGIQIFVAWLYNFDTDFIDEIWDKKTSMGQHFASKFAGYCSKDGYASPNAIMSFIASLSDHYRQELYAYIIEKYKNRWGNK
jgi:hypothetical protein